MIESFNSIYDFIARKENEKLYNDIQIFKDNMGSYVPQKKEAFDRFVKNTLLKPYTDEVDKIQKGTYGYGLRIGEGYITNPASTIAEMEMQFKERVNQDLNFVKNLKDENDKTLNLNKNQIESIASLVYNIGQGRFKNSKAYENLLKGDLEGFKKEAFDSKEGFVKDKKGGKIIEGLVTRRQEEKKLFETPTNIDKSKIQVEELEGSNTRQNLYSNRYLKR